MLNFDGPWPESQRYRPSRSFSMAACGVGALCLLLLGCESDGSSERPPPFTGGEAGAPSSPSGGGYPGGGSATVGSSGPASGVGAFCLVPEQHITVPHGTEFDSPDGCERCLCLDGLLACTLLVCDGTCNAETCPPPIDGGQACCADDVTCGVVHAGTENCIPVRASSGTDPYCPDPDPAQGIVSCCDHFGQCGGEIPSQGTGCFSLVDVGLPRGGECCSACVAELCANSFWACPGDELCTDNLACAYHRGCIGLVDAALTECLTACGPTHEFVDDMLFCAGQLCQDACGG